MNPAFLDYDAVYDPKRLPEIDARFRVWLATRDPETGARFERYRAHEPLDSPQESQLLIAVAQHLEQWLAEAFCVREAFESVRAPVIAERVIHAFRDDFVRRHAKRPARTRDSESFTHLHAHVCALAGGSEQDEELAIARWWEGIRGAPDAGHLELLEDWLWAALNTDAGRAATRDFAALRLPARTNPFMLIPTVPADAEGCRRESIGPFRERDGFDLTDTGAPRRHIMSEVNYCVYCHERESDCCAHGFRDREDGHWKRNALGVELSGCPLHERISEAHLLARDAHFLGALAVIMIDNPLLAATGHRICNDCMKSCIYQKQDPVQIPEVETHILDTVLALPYGFEIYFLLSRWNPLNRSRPYGLPFCGLKVLCVGAGPAGFTLAHQLLQDGFGVALIDGLKIEPLPVEWTGTPGHLPKPVRDVRTLYERLDRRAPRGFGGVAEYGITVRWNKNYLTLIHILIARYACCSITGGLRFGGTITLQDAWDLGFDHVALAMGAGKPAVLTVPDGLAQGVRAASDFLMALQLTGAARSEGLANLQVRLPAVVIGGGLTAIDAATELQAYYIRQVEQFVRRHDALGSAGITPDWAPWEADVAEEYLRHGRLVIAERERAAREGRAPAFRALVHSFGGVTVVYRRAIHQSPAYTRNHEEIIKALAEGIFYAEAQSPLAVCVDDRHRACAVRVEHQIQDPDTGRWHGDGNVTELPARTVLVAAGSVPNTVYAREHPGSLAMEGASFAAHRLVPDGDGGWALERAHGNDPGAFYTSHACGQRFVSFHGDMHPGFHGSVVRAMASGMEGARAIARQFGSGRRVASVAEWQEFAGRLECDLRPVVQAVERLGPRLTRLRVRAPQAARNWHPGQVYRLQNYGRHASRLAGTQLQMEGVALDATQVNVTTGEIELLMRTAGASTRIASRLAVGEPVVLMGPGSAAAPMPIGRNIAVMGGHSAATSLLDSTSAWRARGNHIVFIGHFSNMDQAARLRDEVTLAADRCHWIFEEAASAEAGGGLEVFLQDSGNRPPAADWLGDADLLLVSDDAQSMKRIADSLFPALGKWLKPELEALAVVNSPMQCMMKEVCAQCLCRHRVRDGGRERVVFSCFNHHQPLFSLDCDNLRARQTQNSVQEKLSGLWLQYLLESRNCTDIILAPRRFVLEGCAHPDVVGGDLSE